VSIKYGKKDPVEEEIGRKWGEWRNLGLRKDEEVERQGREVGGKVKGKSF
jgi:hypothetical protein